MHFSLNADAAPGIQQAHPIPRQEAAKTSAAPPVQPRYGLADRKVVEPKQTQPQADWENKKPSNARVHLVSPGRPPFIMRSERLLPQRDPQLLHDAKCRLQEMGHSFSEIESAVTACVEEFGPHDEVNFELVTQRLESKMLQVNRHQASTTTLPERAVYSQPRQDTPRNQLSEQNTPDMQPLISVVGRPPNLQKLGQQIQKVPNNDAQGALSLGQSKQTSPTLNPEHPTETLSQVPVPQSLSQARMPQPLSPEQKFVNGNGPSGVKDDKPLPLTVRPVQLGSPVHNDLPAPSAPLPVRSPVNETGKVQESPNNDAQKASPAVPRQEPPVQRSPNDIAQKASPPVPRHEPPMQRSPDDTAQMASPPMPWRPSPIQDKEACSIPQVAQPVPSTSVQRASPTRQLSSVQKAESESKILSRMPVPEPPKNEHKSFDATTSSNLKGSNVANQPDNWPPSTTRSESSQLSITSSSKFHKIRLRSP